MRATRDSSRRGTVVIDAFPNAALRYDFTWAVVAVDVVRASTTAVTAVATGRRCFPAPNVEAATRRAADLSDPLLAGEVAGVRPDHFEMNNSPAGMASRDDVHRPAVLVSSSGTPLMHNAMRSARAYVGSFRNAAATAKHLSEHHEQVAVVGAGSRGDFREEDQACCARIAAALAGRGFQPRDARTEKILRRWTAAPPEAWMESDSVAYLRASGQEDDLDFIRAHQDDLDLTLRIQRGEILPVPERDSRSRPAISRPDPVVLEPAE